MIEIGCGVALPVKSIPEVFADSQMRFLGGMWVGYGAMLWWVSNDLEKRQVPLAILGGVMLLAGAGRAISGAQYGFRPRVLSIFTVGELVIPLAIWLTGTW